MLDPAEQPTLIFETVHGSTAYGLARAGSDVDIKGVIVGPRRWYFGVHTAPEPGGAIALGDPTRPDAHERWSRFCAPRYEIDSTLGFGGGLAGG